MSEKIQFLVIDLGDGWWTHERVLHGCYNLNKNISSLKLIVNFKLEIVLK